MNPSIASKTYTYRYMSKRKVQVANGCLIYKMILNNYTIENKQGNKSISSQQQVWSLNSEAIIRSVSTPMNPCAGYLHISIGEGEDALAIF